MRLFYMLLLLFPTLSGISQDLKRQGNWGIYTVSITDSVRQTLNIKQGAVEIKWLRPGGTEESAGLKTGDFLYRINDNQIESPEDLNFSGIFNKIRAGEEICYSVLRAGEKIELCSEVQEKPLEMTPAGEVIYDKVKFENGFLRTMITKPNSGKKVPVIYFVPGYNCMSLDNLVSFHPYKRIIDSLTSLGYAVFRCEKSGMGDSFNTPNCFNIDFHTEQKGFEAGYQKMLTYDFIDTGQVFIFGHSLGGINAPLMAEKYHPKGLVVYGTTHLPWMEYLTNMLRYQNPLLGVSPLDMDRELKLYQSLLYEHYVLKKSPEELVKEHPEYYELLERDFQYIGGDRIFQRHYSYMQQLNDLSLSKTWASVDSYVLSIYGEYDFEAINSDAHEEIVRIVNQFHPDKATFLLLPETNHSFIKIESVQAGIEAMQNGSMGKLMRTQFNYDIVTEVDRWIKSLD